MIIGVDEAGRGAWAGPLVAGAVQLRHPIVGLRDSKQLSPSKRLILARDIFSSAFWGIGVIEASVIDDIGLSAALYKAMDNAVSNLSNEIDTNATIIIDGPINYLIDRPHTSSLVKADCRIQSVMAASIIAKVERDRMMVELDTQAPLYGFAVHKGYGTVLHRQRLERYGVSLWHRHSYKPVQAILMRNQQRELE